MGVKGECVKVEEVGADKEYGKEGGECVQVGRKYCHTLYTHTLDLCIACKPCVTKYTIMINRATSDTAS